MPSHTSHSRRPRRHSFNKRPSGNANRGGGRRGPAKSTIDYRRFINESTAPADIIEYSSTHRFADFAFDSRVKDAITAKGYDVPTAIQDQAIPHVLAGRDLIGLANTGTGKTAAFILPIINQLLRGGSGMALVVTPTRELANQINDDFVSFTTKLSLRSAVCVGGMRERPQINKLKNRPHLVVGTPGRLKDFLQNDHLHLSRCTTFVLDEADRMLDMGFINDMRFIMSHLPPKRQSLCFSATITPQIQSIVNTLLTNPVTVSVRTHETSEHIDQDVIHANGPIEKMGHLQRLLGETASDKVLIFAETKHGAQRLSDNLAKQGFTAAAIHGNKSQSQRQRALDAFKGDKLQVLVATDVAARGLDVPSVSHVINYDPPTAYDDYVHRIGRTGRAGQRGKAITFVPSRA